MVGRDSRCGAATRLRGVRCPRRRGLRRVPGAAGQDGGVRHAGHIHGSGIRVCVVQGRGASGDSGVEGPSRRGMRRADMPGTSMGRGYACAWYRGVVRRVILGWKDHHDEECDGPLSEAMAVLAVRCLQATVDGMRTVLVVPAPSSSASVHRRGRRHTVVLAAAVARACRDMGVLQATVDGMRTVLVVPAPSSSASVHRRGRRHTVVLAAAVARACRDMGVDARVVPLLTMDHVRGRSVQMGGGQRSRRVSGRIAVRRPELCRHAHVIVVDDIVTTGATMRQCVDALRSSGAQVVTCLSVAYTPQPDAATVRDSAARDDTSAA